MKTERIIHNVGLDTLLRMPAWVTSARAETTEDVAFLSGAALAMLHLLDGRKDVPHALFRERLALRAAEACVVLLGRPERAGNLRDEAHQLRSGDQPGPAGAIYQKWQRAGGCATRYDWSFAQSFASCDLETDSSLA